MYTKDELVRMLNSVGKTLFATHFEDFQKGNFDIINTYDYTPAAKNTRISKSRSIFNAGQEYEALEIISTARVSDQIKNKCLELLKNK